MKILVRPVREEDAGAIIAILNPLIGARKHTVMDEEISLEDQVGFIRAFPEAGVFHVAACPTSHEVLGLQDVVPIAAERAFRHVGKISTFVRQDAQGRGVGRSLCRATFAAARRHGFEKIAAAVRADNARAVGFYLSRGFRIIGTAQRHARIDGRYIDEVLMETFIDQPASPPSVLPLTGRRRAVRDAR